MRASRPAGHTNSVFGSRGRPRASSRAVPATLLVWCLAVASLSAQSSTSGSDPSISISGYLQPQFEIRSSGGATTDDALFRRLVVSVAAVLPRQWSAEVQLDAGPVASGGDRLIVKDAFLRYTAAGAGGSTS